MSKEFFLAGVETATKYKNYSSDVIRKAAANLDVFPTAGLLAIADLKDGYPDRFTRAARENGLSDTEIAEIMADFGHFKGNL